MKKRILLFWLSLSIFSALFAQQSIFWKISGHGLKEPSYLMGTIHIISKNDFVWTRAMAKALKNAKQICLEVPMGGDADTAMLKYMQLPEGKTLKDYFNAAQYDRLTNYFKDSLNVSISSLENLKPFTLLSLLMYCNAGYGSATTACEKEILQKAKSQQKPVVGLETIQQQMGYVDHQNQDSLAAYVMYIANHAAESRKSYRNMVDLYKKQDLNGLYRLLNSHDMAGFDIEEMVNNRNENWIPKMKEMMQKKSIFFAVGSGHLAGEKGVITLLRKQGFRVKAILKKN